MRSELLIGCGTDKSKKLRTNGADWEGLTTLDCDVDLGPDVVWDLNNLPLPFPDESFDEIHAYDVLEHCGRQGDWRFFFDQWYDFWRLLRPHGIFFGITPHYTSPWAWGDPGHTRILSEQSFTFLSQLSYRQLGRSPMTDYRAAWKGDFDLIWCEKASDEAFRFALRAVKPVRKV